MQLLAFAFSLLASHGAVYRAADSIDVLNGGTTTQWNAEKLTAFVSIRCPAEWARFSAVQPEGLGFEIVKLPAVQDRALRLVWRDWNLVFGDQFEHFQTFVLLSASQVQSYLLYVQYLKSGEVKYLEGSPDADALRAEFSAKTELMTCMLPSDREVGWDVHSYLWPKVLEPLECASWIKMSEAVLQLNVAEAGTPEVNEALLVVLEDTIGQCEKDKT